MSFSYEINLNLQKKENIWSILWSWKNEYEYIQDALLQVALTMKHSACLRRLNVKQIPKCYVKSRIIWMEERKKSLQPNSTVIFFSFTKLTSFWCLCIFCNYHWLSKYITQDSNSEQILKFLIKISKNGSAVKFGCQIHWQMHLLTSCLPIHICVKSILAPTWPPRFCRSIRVVPPTILTFLRPCE